MFMILKKKQMLIATLVIMLAVAGYLNYRYDDREDASDVLSVKDTDTEPEVGDTAMVNADTSKEKTPAEDKNGDYFASYRLEREQAHAKLREDLEKTIANKTISEESKKAAEEQLNNLSAAAQTETSAEAILKSKGFEDAVVYINGDSVNVTVKSDGLSSADTAKIIDAVYELTKNNNIKIVEVE